MVANIMKSFYLKKIDFLNDNNRYSYSVYHQLLINDNHNKKNEYTKSNT